jgi:hypothetical protein
VNARNLSTWILVCALAIVFSGAGLLGHQHDEHSATAVGSHAFGDTSSEHHGCASDSSHPDKSAPAEQESDHCGTCHLLHHVQVDPADLNHAVVPWPTVFTSLVLIADTEPSALAIDAIRGRGPPAPLS